MRRTSLVFVCFLVACGGTTSADPVVATDSGSPEDGVAIDDSVLIEDSARDEGVDTSTDASADAEAADAPSADSKSTACIASATAGTTVISCDGFKYDVTVPPACVAGGCGIVLDVHGLSMSGKMEDNNTAMRALGNAHGYVIVQPNANPSPPTASWTAGVDDDEVFAFLQQAISAYAIDPKRVHMTGFSQGGMMTSRMLCKHADLWASVAPAAGTGCTFSGSDTPSREVHTLYMHGTSDALVAFSVGKAQVDAAVAAWKMSAEPTVESDGKHTWKRWKNAAGTVLEFVEHDYQAASFVLKGHCFPGSADLKGGEPGQLFPFGCTETAPAFTWGAIAMAFFIAHPKP